LVLLAERFGGGAAVAGLSLDQWVELDGLMAGVEFSIDDLTVWMNGV
jgi:hypothetical protein